MQQKTLTETLGLPTQMIAAYFAQTETYFSESGGTFVQVSMMHPTFAANAAAKYIRHSGRWAIDAGQGIIAQPAAWMIRQPLIPALVKRANEN